MCADSLQGRYLFDFVYDMHDKLGICHPDIWIWCIYNKLHCYLFQTSIDRHLKYNKYLSGKCKFYPPILFTTLDKGLDSSSVDLFLSFFFGIYSYIKYCKFVTACSDDENTNKQWWKWFEEGAMEPRRGQNISGFHWETCIFYIRKNENY